MHQIFVDYQWFASLSSTSSTIFLFVYSSVLNKNKKRALWALFVGLTDEFFSSCQSQVDVVADVVLAQELFEVVATEHGLDSGVDT